MYDLYCVYSNCRPHGFDGAASRPPRSVQSGLLGASPTSDMARMAQMRVPPPGYIQNFTRLPLVKSESRLNGESNTGDENGSNLNSAKTS